MPIRVRGCDDNPDTKAGSDDTGEPACSSSLTANMTVTTGVEGDAG